MSELDDAEGGDSSSCSDPRCSPRSADRIAAIAGVAAVERNVESVIQFLDADGRPIGSGQGPPSLGFNAPLGR